MRKYHSFSLGAHGHLKVITLKDDRSLIDPGYTVSINSIETASPRITLYECAREEWAWPFLFWNLFSSELSELSLV